MFVEFAGIGIELVSRAALNLTEGGKPRYASVSKGKIDLCGMIKDAIAYRRLSRLYC